MFKKIFLALGLLIALFVVIVAVQPADFRVVRSTTMAAPPARVFAQVNDFHKWEAWSPWVKLDPNAIVTYEGPTEGAGAKFHWAGNGDVGEGNMTITESRPDERIRIDLVFIKPFAGQCDTLFTFQPAGDQTTVTWDMSGKNNFIAKAINLFIDCDKMVGGQFEQGLSSMKSIVESQPQQ